MFKQLTIRGRIPHSIRSQCLRRWHVKPRLELLEDRLAPATLTVNTKVDDPTSTITTALTLRDAITLVNNAGNPASLGQQTIPTGWESQINTTTNSFGSNDTIQFDPNILGGQTITLGSALPTLSSNVTIFGLGATSLFVSGAGKYMVFNVNNGVTATLFDLTIENGNGDDGGGIFNAGKLTVNNSIFSSNSASGEFALGGGILNDGTLTVNNSNFMSNSASYYGGGIANQGMLTVIGSTFASNSATLGEGGGIENEGTLTVSNSTFSSNFAPVGGGIDNDGSRITVSNSGTLTVSDTTFTRNSANSGGGISNDSGTLTISNGSFTSNSAGNSGGGIYNSAGGIAPGSLTVSNSSFVSNSAPQGGGIQNEGALTVSKSTFLTNSAGHLGGGIYNNSFYATLALSLSTLSGNSASDGGGIAEIDGALTVSNSTLSGNLASGEGGGIWYISSISAPHVLTNDTITANSCNTSGAGSGSQGGGIWTNPAGLTFPTLNNTIIAGNFEGPNGNTPDDIAGTLNSASAYNLVGTGGLQNGVNGNQVGVGNPDLAPLADNGGPTQTMALLSGSPAIGAGNIALAVDGNGIPLLTDQRGFGYLRAVNGSVDIGAYQTQPSGSTSQSFLQAVITESSTPSLSLDSQPLANSFQSVFSSNNPSPLTSATPVHISVSLAGAVQLIEANLAIPANIYLSINGGSWIGGSPALTLTSGNLTVTNATFQNATDAPTILVQGGSLTLQNDDIIQTSTGFTDPAISVTGGTVNLGIAANPGNNTLSVNSFGNLVSNTTGNPISALGDTFEVGGTVETASSLSFTSLASSAASSVFGQAVTFTATVVPDLPGSAPTGSVDFVDSTTGTDLGTSAVSGGTASVSTSALAAGTHVIVATYRGDGSYLPSAGTLTQLVARAPSPYVVTTTADSGPGSLRDAITQINADTSHALYPSPSNPNVDEIDFDVTAASDTGGGYNSATGVAIIAPQSALPMINNSVIIDGTTQPVWVPNSSDTLYNANLPIVLDGSQAGASEALLIAGGNSTVEGLQIQNFANGGIHLLTYGNDRILGNNIQNTGFGYYSPNDQNFGGGGGVYIDGVAGNIIGGTTLDARNELANSGVPVHIAGASNNQVLGNVIGTDGTADLASSYMGVLVNDASYNTIGGTAPGSKNVITGGVGGFNAIEIFGDAGNPSSGNVIQGNYIDTDSTGSEPLPGGYFALGLDGYVTNTLIGGPTASARNVISGGSNTSGGISRGGIGLAGTFGGAVSETVIQGNYIGVDAKGDRAFAGQGGQTSNGITGNSDNTRIVGNVISGWSYGISLQQGIGTIIQGNLIGTDATGTQPIPNGIGGVSRGVGVSVFFSYALIGGTTPGAGNIIAFNDGPGVWVFDGAANSIEGNSIYGNTGLGILLGSDTNGNPLSLPTPNDFLGHTGANNYQDFPILNSATSSSTSTVISGTFSEAAEQGATLTLDFYASPSPDPTGYGQGQTYVGHVTVTTDANGYLESSPDGSAVITSPGTADASFTATFTTVVPKGNFISATATDAAGNTSEFSKDLVVGSFLVTNTSDSGPGSLREAIVDANTLAYGTAANPDQIQFNIPTTDDGYTAPTSVAITNVSLSNNVATLTTSAQVPVALGQTIVVAGLANSIFDGNFQVSAVTPTSFSCTLVHANVASTPDLGTASNPPRFAIKPTSVLPPIKTPVIIDGFSQPGSSANSMPNQGLGAGDNAVRLITLDLTQLSGGLHYLGSFPTGQEASAALNAAVAAAPEAALVIAGGNSTISGLVIQNLNNSYWATIASCGCGPLVGVGTGIHLLSSGNALAGNYITNTATAVVVDNVANNTIGGTTTAARNVLVNNGSVLIQGTGATGNLVQGNYLGTDGIQVLGGGFLIEDASNNVVGGTATGAGNVIASVGKGIEIIGEPGSIASGNLVQGNYIGLNAAGTARLPGLGWGGVLLGGSSNNTIGGTTLSARNIISGWSQTEVTLDWIEPLSTGDVVEGNYIGTNFDGSAYFPEANADGIELTVNSIISGNVIEGCGQGGVVLGSEGGQVTDNTIAFNGSAGVSTGSSGIQIRGNTIHDNGGPGVIVGGTGVSIEGNAIYGNNGPAVSVWGSGVQIEGNSIYGNKGPGIATGGGTWQQIEGNSIYSNTGPGVWVQSDPFGAADPFGAFSDGLGGDISIRNNSIYGNGGLGITLGSIAVDANGNPLTLAQVQANPSLWVNDIPNGLVLNDSLGHIGANNFEDFPVLGVAEAGSVTTITGTFTEAAEPNTTLTLDFYANSAADSSGYGQGQRYLGSAQVTTDSAGNLTSSPDGSAIILADAAGHKHFVVNLGAATSAGEFISATATDPNGNTSEFAKDITAVTDVPLTATGAGTITANEGQSLNAIQVASFNDPASDGTTGSYAATINWGDNTKPTSGSIAPGGASFTVSGSHTYDEEGTYTVIATITDAGGSSITAPSTASVAIVVPKAGIGGPALGVPGQPRTFTFTATHPSQADTQAGFIYNVNWGDGTAQAPDIQTIARTAGNGAGVAADHVYTAPGAYTVSVTATEDGGSTSPAVSQAITLQQVAMEGSSLAVAGTLGNDAITLTPADTTGDITVNLNGTTSFNGKTMFKPTDHILVYGQSGNDTIQLVSKKIAGTTYYITVPAFIYGGGTGNEILSVAGSTANNVVIGGGGTNQITGGLGRDLLIAGLGASKLFAGSGDDILIGGTTDYDLTSSKMTYDRKVQALYAIMTEWGRTDIDYATRVAHLSGSLAGGLNGSAFLNSNTVHSNHVADTLFGAPSPALDWFFADISDLIKNSRKGEVTTQIM
jgi:hypothetical protein